MSPPKSFEEAVNLELVREKEGLINKVENLDDVGANMSYINQRFREYFIGDNYELMLAYFSLISSPHALRMDFSSESSRKALLLRRGKAVTGMAIVKMFEEALAIETNEVEEYNELERLTELKGIVEPAYRTMVELSQMFDLMQKQDGELIKRIFS